tara:strand:- start:103 stop:270 length:168 start_codon:yes stop_codon:yes gene_type:complete
MIRLIILFTLISSCSIKQHNQNFLNFDYDKNVSIDEFKKKLVNYGKISEYPDINK